MAFYEKNHNNDTKKGSLKAHLCRLENLPISLSSYENNLLKILH